MKAKIMSPFNTYYFTSAHACACARALHVCERKHSFLEVGKELQGCYLDVVNFILFFFFFILAIMNILVIL